MLQIKPLPFQVFLHLLPILTTENKVICKHEDFCLTSSVKPMWSQPYFGLVTHSGQQAGQVHVLHHLFITSLPFLTVSYSNSSSLGTLSYHFYNSIKTQCNSFWPSLNFSTDTLGEENCIGRTFPWHKTKQLLPNLNLLHEPCFNFVHHLLSLKGIVTFIALFFFSKLAKEPTFLYVGKKNDLFSFKF